MNLDWEETPMKDGCLPDYTEFQTNLTKEQKMGAIVDKIIEALEMAEISGLTIKIISDNDALIITPTNEWDIDIF